MAGPAEADAGPRIDIIARLKARLEGGHRAEVQLIETILGDLHFAMAAPIADIAARAGVSEPTVTRLARSLGFASTRDMKVHIAQALALGGAYLRAYEASVEGQHTSNQVVATICSRAHAALDLISVALAQSDLTGLGQLIAGSSRVVIYGSGGNSSMAATELQNRLFRLGLNSTAYADPHLQSMSASVSDKHTVIVAFSTSGRARSVLDAVAVARQYGASCIAVTKPGSPLATAVQHVVPFVFEEDQNLLYKPSASRFAMLAVVDILAMAAAEAIGPRVLELLRRVRQSLNTLEAGGGPMQPIGD
ncbi:MAG: MurR/RpiR family transcriptional regulator [Devosia sp.]|uniref:MurR/RpiR family transcriptional regulator n=1 Tax=Devosia sp. TaxID=1871048 RepID=UPI001AC4AF86|nr:MurR/RpiR family transcriptional regulator [Devosia sp.]MBN9311085.1 MurR/RpiR family transcriptional regulator [Devosia sp.]MBN9316841.1 MurR/RpiR family transcriptional regulator [Devosia sp.]